jgi:microcystin-dependent protein
MEVYLGTICAFGFNFAPINWATCQGQTLAIQQNAALYSLLGTKFGGNGQTNFMLPNLQSRVAIGAGHGQSGYIIGQSGGNNSATLTANNVPPHVHILNLAFNVNNRTQDSQSPANEYPAPSVNGINNYNSAASAGVFMAAPTASLAATGANIPAAINVTNPNLALNYCIALQGAFPPRS